VLEPWQTPASPDDSLSSGQGGGARSLRSTALLDRIAHTSHPIPLAALLRVFGRFGQVSGDSEAVNTIGGQLHSHTALVRSEAALALYRTCSAEDPAAKECFGSMLGDSVFRVRKYGFLALARVGIHLPAMIPIACDLLGDRDLRVSSCAAMHLLENGVLTENAVCKLGERFNVL